MMELLRQLLGQHLQPVAVQTDLSAARVPSYAVAHKSEKLLGEDVAGVRRGYGSYAVNLRYAAVGETDRQRAYRLLRELGEWLESLAQNGQLPDAGSRCRLTGIVTKPPAFHEAYDDGTAVWSMVIELYWQKQ